MLYIDDKLPRHPKIMRAGQLLGGGDGPARALAMFLDGLSYTRSYLTDGVIPDGFVAGSSLVRDPIDVARVLANPRVRLWHRVRGGYRIHDYHEWNKTASEIKEIREKWRAKKAAQRRNGNGQYRDASAPMSPGGHDPRLARTRTLRAISTTTTTKGTRTPRTGSSTFRVQPARFARGIVENPTTKTPTHRILCSMLRAELRGDPSVANAIEGVKLRCARQGFDYPDGDRLDAAIQSVARKVPA